MGCISRGVAPLLLGLGLAAAPACAQPASLPSATMAVPAYSLAFSLGYVAEDLGLWAKHGVQIKSVQIAGVGAINAVISGSAGFAEASGSSLTRAAAHGQRLLAIVETLDRPIVQVALRKDIATAGGFDPKAPLAKRALLLKGRTIAVESINSVVHAYVRLLARRAGYDPEAIHIAPMAPANMIAAFASKAIDGFAMSPPWPLEPVLAGTAVMLASGPDGDPPDMQPFANTVVVTRPQLCAEQKALCQGVGQAFAEAAAYVHAQPAAALTLLQKRFPTLDAKLLAASFAEIVKVTPSPPAPTQAALENAERYNVEAGLLRPADKLKSYAGLFTDAYVK